MAGLIERIKNSDGNARRGRGDREKEIERRRRRRGGKRTIPPEGRRVLESVAGLTFGRGRRKRNQLVVRFRNTDLLATPRVPPFVYYYRKTLDDPLFFVSQA